MQAADTTPTPAKRACKSTPPRLSRSSTPPSPLSLLHDTGSPAHSIGSHASLKRTWTACVLTSPTWLRATPPKRAASWRTLAQVIQERFADRLLYVRYLLHQARLVAANTSADAQALSQLQSITAAVRKQLVISLSPYMPREGIGEPAWFQATARGCATSFTAQIPDAQFTKQERLLCYAVDEVLHEICRVYTEAWRDAFGLEVARTDETVGATVSLPVLDKWRAVFDALIEWLDWPIWMKCDPACAVDEFCEMPQLAPWQTGEAHPRCIAIDSEWV